MKKLILAVLVLISLPLRAEIIETNSLAKAIEGADKDTLLVFDVDYTLIAAKQMFGSIPWFYYAIEKFKKEGLPDKDAKDKVIKYWTESQKVTEMEPVEKDTSALIRNAQKAGIQAMALTARPTEDALLTEKQLAVAGIDFSINPPYKEELFLGPKGKLSRYYNGILLMELRDKGTELISFLNKAGIKPKKVIFVDDKKENVVAVDKALTENGIPCRSVRYGKMDIAYKTFNPKVADVQMELFGKILSDEEALAIIKSRKN